MVLFDHLAFRAAVLGFAVVTGAISQVQSTASAEHGMASWYGDDFAGQRAASGEIFDANQLTAAHRTLPFGTKVRVRRLDSGSSIIVRINDRGPFVESRIIDVSYAAARMLGMTNPGLVPVAVEVVEAAPEAPVFLPISDMQGSLFAVRAGTFRNPDNARRTRDLMEEKFGSARITRHGDFLSVQVGLVATQSEAESLAAAVRRGGKAFESAFVVRVDATPTAAE